MTDAAAEREILQAGVVLILIGAMSLAYTVVLYAGGGAAECGPGATILPCSLPFWKTTAVMALVMGAIVMAGSVVMTKANRARASTWMRRLRNAPDEPDA